jgi:hypothetical protein
MKGSRKDGHRHTQRGRAAGLLVSLLRLPEDDAGRPDAYQVAESEKGEERHASGVRAVGLEVALL